MNYNTQELKIARAYNPTLQRLSSFFQRISTIQKGLPFFCSDHSPELVLTHPLQKLIHTIETLQLNLTLPADSQFLGRKRADRLSLAHCFVAKCVLNIPTTKALIERLTIDSPSTHPCAASSATTEKMQCLTNPHSHEHSQNSRTWNFFNTTMAHSSKPISATH